MKSRSSWFTLTRKALEWCEVTFAVLLNRSRDTGGA